MKFMSIKHNLIDFGQSDRNWKRSFSIGPLWYHELQDHGTKEYAVAVDAVRMSVTQALGFLNLILKGLYQ